MCWIRARNKGAPKDISPGPRNPFNAQGIAGASGGPGGYVLVGDGISKRVGERLVNGIGEDVSKTGNDPFLTGIQLGDFSGKWEDW